MMRMALLLIAAGLLFNPGSARAQAKEAKPTAPAKAPAPEGEEEIETYEFSNKVKTGDIGLFMPDERWKKIKTGPPKMKPGGWCEYEVNHPHFNLGQLRISVVPQDGLPDPRWRVVEIRSTDGTGDKSYIKVAFSKPSTDLRNARGMIFKAAGMPPIVLPIGASEEEGKKDAFTVEVEMSNTKSAKVRFLGKKKITVPAGEFETWHYKISGNTPDEESYTSEMWFDITGSVPVLRVVKAKEKDTIMELSAKGFGAKSDLPYMPVGP